MILKKLFSIFLPIIAALVACLPFNYIVGSKAALFSYSTMVIPALGSCYSLVYVIFYIFSKSLFSYKFSYLFFIHRLPLICATRALQSRNIKFFVGLPTLSMILFCMHPVGSQVVYYSWYWFIPMIIYAFVQDSIYSRALAASFVAHAVGSVIWLYTGNIPAETWTMLIPLVAVERLLIAIGMVAFVYVFRSIQSLVSSSEDKVVV